MISKHRVTILGVEQISNNQYKVAIKGYDAEQHREFNDIVTYEDSLIRGDCLNPHKKPLSKSCIVLVKTYVMEAVKQIQ